MFQPTSDLVEQVGSSYILALTAAKRAKQLKEGSPALIDSDSNHSLTIALAEIAQNKVRPVLEPKSEEATIEAVLDEGMLELEGTVTLPPLDVEEDLVTSTGLSGLFGEELQEEEGHEEEVADIAALLEDEDEEAVASEEEEVEPLVELDPEDIPDADVILEEETDASEDELTEEPMEDPLD